LRTVGRPLLPTRTSASTSRCSNRTSIVGMSIPTLHEPPTKCVCLRKRILDAGVALKPTITSRGAL
jgi:hypothetical protein